MPAVLMMENGGQDGLHTGHDRPSSQANGAAAQPPLKDAPAAASAARTGDAAPVAAPSQLTAEQRNARMNDLPEEIVHITEGFVPLSLILGRMTQTTLNAVQEKMAELAKMPVPSAAMNGAATNGTSSDDASNENIRKKTNLLTFAQELHGRWVKALVITEWSRNSDMVSKLIDLKWHIDQQRILYDSMLDQIVHVKRDLTFARMPSPDLKTSLKVLSTGSAPWMPDLHYIEPPPLDADDQLKWISDLDTLLSLRLNLDEFDRIPPQFRNYEIESGRVTFKVDGEFEVDLTIADEDFEKQFWFIDFRFSYRPAAAAIPETMRAYLEGCVNEALARDGLAGCYRFLHEFALTCKINEIRRQALHLSRTAWTGTLKVEPLHRALAIQYWTARLPPNGPKSWVMIAVNSGRGKTPSDPEKETSHLEVKWYRDNKEVVDSGLTFDLDNLSAAAVLRTVVGRHIEFILRGIHDKLLVTPRFKTLERRASIEISETDPMLSCLTVQMDHSKQISLTIEPKTGVFAISPSSRLTYHQEQKLNSGTNQIEGGFLCLEELRCTLMEDEISRRSAPLGWHTVRAPLKDDEVRSIIKLREWTQVVWLRRGGWPENWCMMVILALGGNQWWLVETTTPREPQTRRFQLRLPLPPGPGDLSERFWHRATILTTALISHCIDMATLHRQRIKSRLSDIPSRPGQAIKLPVVDISLSSMFPHMAYKSADQGRSASGSTDGGETRGARSDPMLTLGPREPWAKDNVTLRLKMVRAPPREPKTEDDNSNAATQLLICVSEAVIAVEKPGRLGSIKGQVDDSVRYDSKKGEFTLLMTHPVGESTLDMLKTRIVAIDRFVRFLEALRKSKGAIQSETVSLKQVSFLYRPSSEASASSDAQRWRVTLDLSQPAVDVRLDQGNPHLRVIDLMKRLVNIDGGIGTLMSWLPRSLPTLTAMDAIESRWEDTEAEARGSVEFTAKTMDWMRIRYTVMGSDGAGKPVGRVLALDGRIRLRHNQPWWYISRIDGGSKDDRFAAALKPVWEGRGDGWQGLATGAAGRLLDGAPTVLEKIDEAVRALVGNLEGDKGFETVQQTNTLDQINAQTEAQAQAQLQARMQAQAQQMRRARPPQTGRGPEHAIEIS